MKKALENMDLAMQINPNLKVFGICFGHQWLCRHYNAKIERRKRKAGLETIVLD